METSFLTPAQTRTDVLANLNGRVRNLVRTCDALRPHAAPAAGSALIILALLILSGATTLLDALIGAIPLLAGAAVLHTDSRSRSTSAATEQTNK